MRVLKLIVIIIIYLTCGHAVQFGSEVSTQNNKNQEKIHITPNSLLNIISVELKNIPIEDALLKVAQKGGFKLNYKRSYLPHTQKITLKINQMPAIKVIQKILKGTETELKIVKGGHFIIIPKDRNKDRHGAIYGKVEESLLKRMIPGVLIQIMHTNFSTVSDENGEFKIFNIPARSYSLSFSIDGFKPLIKTDVIVHPGRITYVYAKMVEKPLDITETIDVSGSYFQKNENMPTSSINISAQEIIRAPGGAAFVDRVLPLMPGIVQRRDGTADLMIRGGCPTENAIYIDNIEVPYISHVPTLGSTGGKFSSIHPDLIQTVNLSSGIFSADYGGRLSSVTDITFREGNRNEFDGQVDANLLLTGTLLEGPLVKGRGSWLISARASYTQLLGNLGLLSETAPLETSDILAKLTYDLSDRHKFSILNFTTWGFFQDDHGYSIEDRKYLQNVSGFNWHASWSNNFFSTFTLSYSILKRWDKETYPQYTYQGYQGQYYWRTPDTQKYIILKNINHINFQTKDRLEFGVEVKNLRNNIQYYSHEYHDDSGVFHQSWGKDFNFHLTKTAIFLTYTSSLFQKLTTAIGLRGNYSSILKTFHLAPRFSLSFPLSQKLTLNAGIGVVYQSVPIRFQSIFPQHRLLKDLKAIHHVLGIEYINAGTKISVEAYHKKYENMLIDEDMPYALASEQAIEQYYYPSALTNSGKGYARGIELLIHQKLVKRFYSLFSISLYQSRYKDLNAVWRRSPYDNRYIINILAGYKPNSKWELGLSSTFMGGRPCTPFDLEASRINQHLISDPDISKINTINYPAYRRVNFRIERKYYFGKTNFIVFLDLLNVLGFKNAEEYEWDTGNEEVVPDEGQMPFLPIIGLKLEF
jgi:outer membrane receptor for ferrienterochelin and colicin